MLVSKLSMSFLLCAFAATTTLSLAADNDPTPPPPAKPTLEKPQAGFLRMKVGNVDVIALSDGSLRMPLEGIVINAKPGELDKLLTFQYEKSPIFGSVNSYLIHLGDRWILVDSGTSNLFGPTVGKLPISLKNAGIKPEDISDIFITHLHPDHVGGVSLNGKKVYPNATLHFNKNEAGYWLNKDEEAKAPPFLKPMFKLAQETVKPYTDTNKLSTFTDSTEFFPGFKSQPAYGHTPGHSFYVLEDNGQKIVFVGDMIHVPAAQFDNPEIALKYDCDSPTAVVVRKKLLADAAEKGYEIGGAHLPYPGCGHVRKEGDHYRWIPVQYVNDSAAQ